MTRAKTVASTLALLVILCLAAILCSTVGAAGGEAQAPAMDDPIGLALLGAVRN